VIAALVLIGAPGTGKSSVLDALGTLLEREEVEHGAIESEELTRGFPPLSNAVLADQLAAALALQRSAGRRLFLVAFTPESDAELRSVMAATCAQRILVACLRAPAETIATRLRVREPDRWPGKEALIARAGALSGRVPALEGIDVTLDAEAREADDLARTVLAAMRERGLLAT
jgi:chloramphenicol 3-O-phosphotransferase